MEKKREKRTSRKGDRIVSVCMVLVFFVYLFLGIQVNADAGEQKTVKIGYYEAHDFQEGADDSAAKSGYSYEYIQKVASYTGWRYQYVYGEWKDLYEKLKTGEIDLMAGISYDDDRVNSMLFPEYEMINETFYIYKDTDDTTIKFGNIDSYAGKKIGVVNNDKRMMTALEDWAKEKQADIQIQYYDSLESCAADFNQKNIDAFVSADNVASSYTGISPVEKIGKEAYYLCVAKDREDLLDELNMALSIITEQDALDVDELHKKYSAESSVTIFLSEKEQDWLAEHDTVTVGYSNDYLPYCDTDKDGKATGLVSDLIPDMFDALPGDYEPDIIYRGYNSQNEMVEALKNGDVDMIFPVSSEAWYAEQEGYQESTNVVTSPIDLVYREPYTGKMTAKIAVNKNNQLQYNYTVQNYPDAEIIQYDSIEECIKALKSGEVGSTILSARRANYLVGAEKKLNVLPLENTEERCIGVAFGNTALLQIINHGLSILGENYGLNHTYTYMDAMRNYTAMDFIQDNIWIFTGILIVIFLCIIWYFCQRDQNMQKQAKKEAKQKQELENALTIARQANRARGVFLRNMSHDIRTPLNAIIGFAKLAMKSEGNFEQIQDYLNKISVSGDHLLAIVNDVLEVSRIESGQTKLEELPCNIKNIVDEVEVIIQGQAQEKTQTFIVDTSKVKDYYIYCDRLRVKEVLVNLLGNAVKFTPKGGKIELRIIQNEPAPEGYANYEVHVKDNGCGMSPEFMGKMFLPFERERTSTVSGIQGTGLGLSIAKQFVDLMGGTIEVTSKEKEGTEVIVRISPRLAQTEKEERTENTESEEKDYDFRGKRILVVEDNELNREIVKAVLEETGFEVEEAENGAVAVDKIKTAGALYYDVVLMDIQMPVMNGYDAARAIRQLTTPHAAVSIIAMTANAFEEDKQKAFAAGMDAYITKPVDVVSMMKTLHQIIETHRSDPDLSENKYL